MKTITAAKVATAKKRLDETGNDFTTLISESCVVNDAAGNPLIVYLDMDEDLAPLANGLRQVRYEKSGRTGGLPTISRVFGYQPRVTIRRDFCAAASLNSEVPGIYALIKNGAASAAQKYHRHNTDTYMRHWEQTRKIDRWRIGNTPFTSGIINKNNQLRYHYDSGNIKDCWSAMFVFKKDISGGHLSCPEYGLGFELKNNSLLLFDGQSILHGVTQFKLLTPDAYRISIVYYSLAGMWKCLSPEGELARIRKVKTARETKRAA
jgi:hypothetical protein